MPFPSPQRPKTWTIFGSLESYSSCPSLPLTVLQPAHLRFTSLEGYSSWPSLSLTALQSKQSGSLEGYSSCPSLPLAPLQPKQSCGSGNVAGETAKTSEDRQVDPNLFLTMLYVSVVPFPCGRKMQPSVARPFPTLANSIEILLVNPLNRRFNGSMTHRCKISVIIYHT